MKYEVQRALNIEGKIYNIGDYLLVKEKGKDDLYLVKLLNIRWIDEYNACIETGDCTYDLRAIDILGKVDNVKN